VTKSSQTGWKRRFVVGAALVFWCALSLQLVLTIQRSNSNGNSTLYALWTYFAYFTIWTNLLAAVALTWPLARADSAAGRFFARPRTSTAIAAYMLLVGVAYNLLLRNVWQPHGFQLLADLLLHSINPLLFLGYWYLFGRDRMLKYTAIVGWAAYPIGYFIYAIGRGLGGDNYAYPFIDLGTLGLERVLINALFISLGFAALSGVLIAWGHRALGQAER
jgi:hypothetical protein